MKESSVVIQRTEDGSCTLYSNQFDALYHSRHGAIQESIHVFIQAGLNDYLSDRNPVGPVRILEYGFGTGLNAYLTWIESLKSGVNIEYTGLENFPVDEDIIRQLNYTSLIKSTESFSALHASNWGVPHAFSDAFTLLKLNTKFEDFRLEDSFDIVYYDAFGPNTQPSLWQEAMLERVFFNMRKHGVFLTYSSKGEFRRALKRVGFSVEKIPGPPGKREMTRAFK